MYYKILPPSTIQLSESYREGYTAVIVDDKPEYDHTTHHLEPNYAIIDNAVHQTWNIVEGEGQITDSEALSIIL